MRKAIWAALMALAIVASVAACSGSEGSTPAPAPQTGSSDAASGTESPEPGATAGTVMVSGKEFAFDPTTIELPADTPTAVAFTNEGNIEHDLTIEGYEGEALIATAGQTQTGTYTLPAGTYKFYCSIPGHESAGMVGTIEVG